MGDLKALREGNKLTFTFNGETFVVDVDTTKNTIKSKTAGVLMWTTVGDALVLKSDKVITSYRIYPYFEPKLWDEWLEVFSDLTRLFYDWLDTDEGREVKRKHGTFGYSKQLTDWTNEFMKVHSTTNWDEHPSNYDFTTYDFMKERALKL